MQYGLTEEQRTLVSQLEELSMAEFRPTAFAQAKERSSVMPNLKLLADHGYLGLSMPTEVGGKGLPYLDTMMCIEAISRACPATGESALMAMCGPAMFISQWGSADQLERFVRPVVEGRRSCWISLTEEPAGTALTDLQTSAVIDGDTCVINGHKRPSTVGTDDDYYLVFVRLGPGNSGVGAVIVETDTPGFVRSEPRTWMGGTPWVELTFDNATIPATNVLERVPGISGLLVSYSIERCAAGAFVLGVARAAIDLAIDFARTREQFGRPIGDFQMVQAKLANMYIAHESARQLLYRAVAAFDAGDPEFRVLSSAAKVLTTKVACEVIDDAMQIFGHQSMSADLTPLEWFYRLIRPYRVAGGTSDIHRSMIAGSLLGTRVDHRAG
jgi:alkylation response protein AidB-like acyl-CoA dehydrogenase